MASTIKKKVNGHTYYLQPGFPPSEAHRIQLYEWARAALFPAIERRETLAGGLAVPSFPRSPLPLAYEAQGPYDRGMAWFNQQLSAIPQDPSLLFIRIHCAVWVGGTGEAFPALKRAFQSGGETVGGWALRNDLFQSFQADPRWQEIFRARLKSPIPMLASDLRRGQSTQHQIGHGQINPDLTRLGQGFIVLAQAPIASQPRERALHHPTAGQQLKSLGPLGTLHGLHHPTAPMERPIHQRSGIVPVCPQQPQPRKTMDQLGQHPARSLLIRHFRRMDHDGQQQTQGIDDEMPLPTGDLLPPIKTAFPSLLRGFDRLTVDAAGTGRGIPAGRLAHLGPQDLMDPFPRAIPPPAAEIVVNRPPGGKVARQHPPSTAAAQHIQEGVVDRPQADGTGSPPGFGGGQQGLQQSPFSVIQITRIAWIFHHLWSVPQRLPLFKHALRANSPRPGDEEDP